MASPPFNPNEALPSDSGVISLFPSQERTFRDIIESWLLWEHDRSGYHKFDMDTEVNRDADSTRPAGSLFWNTDDEVLQFLASIGPQVWDTISFPPGTRMLFQQTAAPVGWTKVTDAAYNNVALRLVTGSVSSGGTVDFDAAFTEQEITGTVDDHTLTVDEIPLHGHPFRVTSAADDGNGSGGILLRSTGTITNQTFTGTPTDTRGEQIGGSGGGQAHGHGFTGDAVDLAVKYRDVILCEKDAL